MKTELFEMINRMENDLNEYEEIILTGEEQKENCRRILNKVHGMEEKHMIKTGKIGKKIVAAGLVLFLGLISAATVSYASNGRVFDYLYSFFSGGGITYQEGEDGGHITTVVMDATEHPPVILQNGTLYFTADGGRTDITDLISDQKAFVADCMDEQGNTHQFIVGGKAGEEAYGYQEYIYDRTGARLGGSGYYGSRMEGAENLAEEEPEWLIEGKNRYR